MIFYLIKGIIDMKLPKSLQILYNQFGSVARGDDTP